MEFMGEHYIKRAVIAGASHALKFKGKNPRATDQEILKDVTENAEKIVRKIDEDE